MIDKDFLVWLKGRLRYLYEEDCSSDYMIRLQKIIDNMPEDENLTIKTKESIIMNSGERLAKIRELETRITVLRTINEERERVNLQSQQCYETTQLEINHAKLILDELSSTDDEETV